MDVDSSYTFRGHSYVKLQGHVCHLNVTLTHEPTPVYVSRAPILCIGVGENDVIYSGSADGTIRQWEMPGGKDAWKDPRGAGLGVGCWNVSDECVWSLDIFQDRLLSASADGMVR